MMGLVIKKDRASLEQRVGIVHLGGSLIAETYLRDTVSFSRSYVHQTALPRQEVNVDLFSFNLSKDGLGEC